MRSRRPARSVARLLRSASSATALLTKSAGVVAIKLSSYVLRVPANILMPLILLFCIVGSFAVQGTSFAIWIMLVLGVLAYLMEENDIPVAPAIPGLLRGKMVEDTFMVSMMSLPEGVGATSPGPNTTAGQTMRTSRPQRAKSSAILVRTRWARP